MNITIYPNITNNNNISLFNISNYTNNKKYIYYRNYNYVWVFFFFIFIFYTPILALFGLLKESLYEIMKCINKLLFYRLNRTVFIVEMGNMEHKITNKNVLDG